MKEEISDDLVKNVKRQAESRAALIACLFTPGMEGDFANEELMIISCGNEEDALRKQEIKSSCKNRYLG